MNKKVRIIILCIAAVLILFAFTVGKTFTGNVIGGRVHFPKENLGKTLVMENGQKFSVFRTLTVSGKNAEAKSLAVFRVRFKFSGLSPQVNKRLSMIPAPFLMGMKGFREKNWMMDEDSGYFQGVYQWESKELAEAYPSSFIFKLMTKRAAPGTVSYEIMPDTNISEYIKTRIVK